MRVYPTNHLGKWLLPRLAAAAATAYTTDTVKCGRTGAAANVTVENGAIIVAFRGSQSIRDFIADGEFIRWPWWVGLYRTEIHHGFQEYILSIWQDVLDQVKTRQGIDPHFPIYICGHSLGGALATLFGLRLLLAGIRAEYVITFGKPRVGNAAWRNVYNATDLKERTLHVVNENDIVTHLPAWIDGYRHEGNTLFLTKGGNAVLNPTWLTRWQSDLRGFAWAFQHHRDVLITDHFIASYENRLKNL